MTVFEKESELIKEIISNVKNGEFDKTEILEAINILNKRMENKDK